jgi:hypothetical protein
VTCVLTGNNIPVKVSNCCVVLPRFVGEGGGGAHISRRGVGDILSEELLFTIAPDLTPKLVMNRL